MISQYDIIRALRKPPKNSVYQLDEAEKNIVNTETGNVVCSVAEFTNDMRKKHHCDFDVIYDEHASLSVIYQCRECGTVIFGGDDEDRYDPNLECPVCGKYKTYLQYWTKEEIESDIEKQETLLFYKRVMEEMAAQARRKKERGLNDWEIWKSNIKTQNGRIEFALECTNLFHNGLKGLCFKIVVFKNEEAGFLIKDKDFYIPLSRTAFRVWKHRQELLKNGNVNKNTKLKV